MAEPQTFHGGCHCGNIKLRFQTNTPPAQLPVRICLCYFCRKVGARYTSDPAGRLQIQIRDFDEVIRYRFALKTADFLTCGICGIYVGAILKEEDSAYAVLSVQCLDQSEEFSAQAKTFDFSSEDVDLRQARRVKNWIPTQIVG